MLIGSASALEEDVQLVVNELKIFPVHRLIRVAVGDPEIADITILSERELMLMAKRPGATSLLIWDESGQHSFNVAVIEKDLEYVNQSLSIPIAPSLEGTNVFVHSRSWGTKRSMYTFPFNHSQRKRKKSFASGLIRITVTLILISSLTIGMLRNL